MASASAFGEDTNRVSLMLFTGMSVALATDAASYKVWSEAFTHAARDCGWVCNTVGASTNVGVYNDQATYRVSATPTTALRRVDLHFTGSNGMKMEFVLKPRRAVTDEEFAGSVAVLLVEIGAREGEPTTVRNVPTTEGLRSDAARLLAGNAGTTSAQRLSEKINTICPVGEGLAIVATGEQ